MLKLERSAAQESVSKLAIMAPRQTPPRFPQHADESIAFERRARVASQTQLNIQALVERKRIDERP